MPALNGHPGRIRRNVPWGVSSSKVLRAAVEPEPADIADLADLMREDYQVAFAERVLFATIHEISVTVSTESDDPRAALLADQLQRLWDSTLANTKPSVGEGRVAFEKVFDYSGEANLAFVRKLQALPFRNSEMKLGDDGEFLGIKIKAKGKEELLPPDKSWWLALDATAIEPHGRSRFLGAPREQWNRRRQLFKLLLIYLKKYCLRGGVAHGPNAEQLEDGTIEDYQAGLQKALDDLQEGGIFYLPGLRDPVTGSFPVEFTEQPRLDDPSPIENSIERTDVRMLRAFGISELAVSQTAEVGSFAMATMHRLVLVSVAYGIVTQFAESFQKYVADKTVEMNFDAGDAPKIVVGYPSLEDLLENLATEVVKHAMTSPQLSPLLLSGAFDLTAMLESAGLPLSADAKERIDDILQEARELKQQRTESGMSPENFANLANAFSELANLHQTVNNPEHHKVGAAPRPPGQRRLKAVKKKAWDGKQAPLKNKLSKLETGETGERVTIDYLVDQGHDDARTLNVDVNNFPVDLVQNHEVIEVKAGLASNSKSAQQWRATIGQPGKEESEWLKRASKEEKAAWNAEKAQSIMERKQAAVEKVSKELGTPVKGKTIALILNPDTKTADVYEFEGFHHRIGWNSPQAKSGFKGTFQYE